MLISHNYSFNYKFNRGIVEKIPLVHMKVCRGSYKNGLRIWKVNFIIRDGRSNIQSPGTADYVDTHTHL